MFTQKWRGKWGLLEDPFTSEDADKDVILGALDASVTHWGFDRVFGNPKMPAPAVVFGEKGSGKSALRLITRKRVDQYNAQHPNEKVFFIEYTDFNPFIENYRRTIGGRSDQLSSAQEVVKRWKISDHLDCILTLGVTKLVDELIESPKTGKNLTRKQKINLMLMTALYYSSETRAAEEALHQLSKTFRVRLHRPLARWFWVVLASLAAVGLLAAPHVYPALPFSDTPRVWYIPGLVLLAMAWGWAGLRSLVRRRLAGRGARAVRGRWSNPVTIKRVLDALKGKERQEVLLPFGDDEDSRYQLLSRFIGDLQSCGYDGVYVLLDRIDEPSLLSSRVELMRQFVEKLLDIKLLQFPKLGIKLFLPIELDSIYRNADTEALKKMRLDKSNLIAELKWSGAELYEIANQRLQACREDGSTLTKLDDILAEDFDIEHLKETLGQLGTPRYAFGFLSEVIAEYVKDLPNDLPEDDPRWRITQNHFDIIRAAWIDKSGVLRRTLN